MPARSTDDHLWDTSAQITSTGSANAYVIAITEQLGGYYQGMPPIRFKANFSCTGSATANIVTENAPGGLGAVTLKKNGGASNLVTGDIVSGGIYTLSHDGTNFQVLELNATITSVTGFPMTASGDRWGVIAPVGTDGVMEVGKFIDFHNSDADATDFAVRLETGGLTSGLFYTPAGSGIFKRVLSARNSTLAQGDIFYYDGADFVRLAPGTSGLFLQTLGAGANPQWAAAGGMQLLTSGTVSAAASLDIVLTSYTAYRNILIDLQGIVPATDDTQFFMRTSTNGGSSYDAGATDYSYAVFSHSSAASQPTDQSNGAAQIGISVDDGGAKLSSDAGAGASYMVSLPNRLDATKCQVQWTGGHLDTSARVLSEFGTGYRNTAADVDAVRFLLIAAGPTAVNITSAKYAVYGLS